MKQELEIPAEYVEPLLICAAAAELSVDDVVTIVLKFYLARRNEDHA